MQNSVDVLVGKRVRMRRLELSLSQSELAEKIGVTFQQVQKYERGTNRISCSRLTQIAAALDVKLAYFFGEDAWGNGGPGMLDGLDVEKIPEGQRLLSAFMSIKSQSTRSRAIRLLESIANTSK